MSLVLGISNSVGRILVIENRKCRQIMQKTEYEIVDAKAAPCMLKMGISTISKIIVIMVATNVAKDGSEDLPRPNRWYAAIVPNAMAKLPGSSNINGATAGSKLWEKIMGIMNGAKTPVPIVATPITKIILLYVIEYLDLMLSSWLEAISVNITFESALGK